MKMIVWRFWMMAVAVGLAAGGVRAVAQAMPTASGPGSFVAVGGGVSAYQADYGQRWLGGEFAYVDVHPTWRFGLEGEARFLNAHTDEDVKQFSWLGGPIVYIRPERLRPYVKFLAGAGKLDFPFHYAKGTYFAMAPGAGVDWQVSDRLAVRLIDVEYQDWPQFTYGALHPYGISAGISYRVNPSRLFPKHASRHY